MKSSHFSSYKQEFLPSTALGPLYENMARDPFKSHGPKISMCNIVMFPKHMTWSMHVLIHQPPTSLL
jgi:hypothetical protein